MFRTYGGFSGWTRHLRKNLANYLFILPALVGVVAFSLGPMIASLFLSLTDYDVLSPASYVGLQNYMELFDDQLFGIALRNTIRYVGATLPLRLIIALGAAVLLNQQIRGIGVFRTIFYLPSVSAGVAVSLLWQLIYQPQFGLANNLLARIGIRGPAWLGDPQWAMRAIVIMMALNVGRFMIIFLGGLQTVPTQLYEAVQLDGGRGWHQFCYVTLPHLTPVIFFNMVIGMIEMVQMFTQVYVMTGGGPMDSTLVYVLYIYQKAFQYLEMGYASALAWVLFLILFVLTITQFKVSDRWVYYEAEGDVAK